MNYKIVTLSCIMILGYSGINAQKNDHNWVLGFHGFSTIDRILSDSLEKTFWPFTLDFNEEPMQIKYFPYRRFIFDATNGNYSTDEGSLYCYTNGMQLYGPDDSPLVGGDTINYNTYWRYNVYSQTGEILGFRQIQGNIILPIESDKGNYLYILNNYYSLQESGVRGIWYSIVDMACDEGRGCVVEKDKSLISVPLKSGKLQACRHGNGRDWWIIAISEDNTTYYIFLLDGQGVQLYHTQAIGRKHTDFDAGNATFSHGGDRYAVNDGNYWDSTGVISVFDFDRCSGLLANLFFDTLVIPEGSVGQGIAFSPNDRYLYINNMHDLYQYDLENLSLPRRHIATYDGYYYGDNPNFRTTEFGFWGYGPDGRLYNVSGAASAKHMHIMDYPNEPGEACSFRQHVLKIPNNPWSIPNFPHYRLGPLDGSPCDTLGLDNHPVAKYRYDADSIDHLRIRFTDLSYYRPESWSWDFGDGSPAVYLQHPYHTYTENGVYDVCLTVRNEYSSHTYCRTLALGVSSTDDSSTQRAEVSLFPNPVQDHLIVTLGDYIPEHGRITLYERSGQEVHSQRIYYGQNSIDISHLPAGLYIYRILDGRHTVSEGKVVKGNG